MVSAPYISLEKEAQVYFSKTIILNLETIFNLDNNKNWCMESRTSIHTSAVKMTSINIGIKPNLRLMTIFYPENQKLVSRLGCNRRGLTSCK